MKKGLIIAILACVSGGSNARALSGNQLYQARESESADVCAAYISGVMHGYLAAVIVAGAKEGLDYDQSVRRHSQICQPKGGIGGEKTHAIVIQYLKDNPEIRSAPAFSLIVNAARDAYPCD